MGEQFGPIRYPWFVNLKLRSRVAVLAALVLGGFASCSSDSPAAPKIDPSPDLVAGVAWFDDGDESIGPGERPAEKLVSHLGLGTQILQSPSEVRTDNRGGFVLDVPELDAAAAAELFVQITFPVEGPAGKDIEVQVRRPARPGDVDVEIPVLQPTRCAAELDALLAGSSECGNAQLPDLVPLVEDFGQPPTQPIATRSARVDTTTLPGTPLLRFASATANLGAGPLHMIPERAPTNGRIPTWQRLWTDENRFVDQRTGSFVFHEDHDHFHLDGFEHYRLLGLEGEVVATGEKVSFCLIDALAASPSAQTRGQGIFLDAVCEQAGAQQALNPGWADYYGAGLPDQWIDITGVAPGDYLVEIIADPDNVLLESDETNNRAQFPVTITAAELNEN
jgi:hypothetical protein